MRSCVKTACLILVVQGVSAFAEDTEVSICTDVGNFVIALDATHAPLHTANFLHYVDEGYFNGTVFHRVIADFMVQGGGFDRNLIEKPTLGPVQNESRNGLANDRGSVAAARTTDPHSARSQFFVNVADNPRLDGNERDWGYTVFGRVVSGMDSIDRIAALPTSALGPFTADVPNPLVAIRSAARLDRDVLTRFPEPERAQQLRAEISTASDNGDFASALAWLGQLRADCTPLDAELLLIEAHAAAEQQTTTRALAALDEYFATNNETAPHYADALALRERLDVRVPGFGACSTPHAPDVPDGSEADLAAMLDGQTRVQSFMRDSTAYLECLDKIIDGDSSDAARRAAAVNEYNRMVDVTQRLGDDFNAQVRAYRARQ